MNLEVGQLWRAKRPAPAGVFGDVNDRRILWMGKRSFAGGVSVQYDSPAVGNGRRYPTVTKAMFKAWAGELLTTESWTTWAQYQKGKP